MRNNIITAIADGYNNAKDIAELLGLNPKAVQYTLIEMDDAGEVLMRNGWYRLSEKAKRDLND